MVVGRDDFDAATIVLEELGMMHIHPIGNSGKLTIYFRIIESDNEASFKCLGCPRCFGFCS